MRVRRYWLTKVSGKAMQDHCNMEGVEVGNTDAIQGVMN